jgi:hypothetical protein
MKMVAVGATKAYISRCKMVFVFVIGDLMMMTIIMTKNSRSLSTLPAAGFQLVVNKS